MVTPHAACAVSVFPTPLGWMAIVGRAGRLARLVFGQPSRAAALAAVESQLDAPYDLLDWNPTLVEQLQRYASGQRVDFHRVPLESQPMTPFQRRVLAECRRIGYGRTASYGELARRAGYPGAARAVGTVMRNNRVPLIVPCHRVLAAGGLPGGYSAPGGVGFKRRLLDIERAVFSPSLARRRPR